MRTALGLVLVALSTVPLAAQNRSSLVFTGRFPFRSLDAANERPGGSITEISEFAFTLVTPGSGRAAVSWVPATTHEAYMGDVFGTGNYTPLRGLKTYGQRINMASPFMKAADKASADPRLIYWTVRDQEAGIDILVPDQNGTRSVVVLPGDFVRIEENGNLEYFIRQSDFATAAGAQTGAFAHGASALCQDAQGNLYYSPAEGGHWINGNLLQQGPKFVFDGSICKIPASAITYDVDGNVQSVAADSAYMVFSETEIGLNSGPSIRSLVQNANAYDYNGTGLLTTTANMVGLDFDPNGGTTTASWPLGDPAAGGTYDTLPNFVFTFDNGTWGGTIFSTANNGSIAVINGIKCGSDIQGLPADGSWLGVALDVVNFQPTVMGLLVIPEVTFQPFVHDVPEFGALDPSAVTLGMDYHGVPAAGVFVLMTFGPTGTGGVAPAIDFGNAFGSASYNTLFTIPTPTLPVPVAAFLGTTNPNGYAAFVIANPNTPAAQGAVLMTQGVAISGGALQVSNPAVIQYK